MTVLSSKEVERLLAINLLTGWEKMKYLMIVTVLGFFSRPVALVSPIYSKPSLIIEALDLASVAASILIVVYGIKRCFKINEVIDQQHFIERFAILSVPVSIKILIVGIPGSYILLWVLFDLFREKHPGLYQFVPGFLYIMASIVTCIYYFLLKRSFVRFGQLVKVTEQATGFK